MKKNVRLVDIAEKLDLTKVSVSKALRDHPDISAKTRKKVKKVAREMGYRPNLLARSLASQKSQTIGVIIPKMANSFFASVVEGIYSFANESDYDVVLGISLEDEKLEKKHIESMLNMRVDGLLVSITEQTKDPERFEIVRDMGIDLVFFDRGFSNAGFTYIKVDDKKSAKAGLKFLLDKGYKEIAHLAGYESIEIGSERKTGYLEALKEASIELPENMIIEGGYNEKDGYLGFKKLLERYGKPSALFAVTYPVGLGALEFMKEKGMDPNEITILSFGSSEFNQHLINPFICIEQPRNQLGQKAFEQIIKEMNSDMKSFPETIELSAKVNEYKL
ncbi:MAG: LacI family DNA-binding transcriptional regulator [Balneolaceae bacterium]|nr:LacI family DNA-binding transcriptional regulator [Balneolaceae bacterium]MDR9408796.1 LacI family DNA-binding transcriptional regulator [Balneolaceae bacterium]